LVRRAKLSEIGGLILERSCSTLSGLNSENKPVLAALTSLAGFHLNAKTQNYHKITNI